MHVLLVVHDMKFLVSASIGAPRRSALADCAVLRLVILVAIAHAIPLDLDGFVDLWS